MLKNQDGTPYSGETISEILEQRFITEPYPFLSDILGSDWGTSFELGTNYKVNACLSALAQYEDKEGCIKRLLDSVNS